MASNRLTELARQYLEMVDEPDGHTSTDAQNAERTNAHNALIESLVEENLISAPSSRATARWLARYLFAQIPSPGSKTRVMFARKSNNEIVNIPPFAEWEESKVLDLYYPVVVTIRPWDRVNGLSASGS